MSDVNLTSPICKTAFDYGFKYSDPALVKKLKQMSEIPVEITKDPLHAGNAFYHMYDKKIMISPELKNNPFILSHEMGHHELSKAYISNFLQQYLTDPFFQTATSMTLNTMGSYLMLTVGKIKAGVVLQILGAAPNFLTLLNEWFAWRQVKKLLLNAGFDETKLNEFEAEKKIALKTYLDAAIGQSLANLVLGFIMSQGSKEK